MAREPGEQATNFIISILLVVVLAVLVGAATLIPVYDCEACSGTGWNQGFLAAGTRRGHCRYCDGTVRISFWSAKVGAHAKFMSHFK